MWQIPFNYISVNLSGYIILKGQISYCVSVCLQLFVVKGSSQPLECILVPSAPGDSTNPLKDQQTVNLVQKEQVHHKLELDQ